MKIIDARSGHELVVGQKVVYPDGESVTLLSSEEGLMAVEAIVMMETRNAGVMTKRAAVRSLPIRFLHPAFLFQRVAFLDT